MDDFNNPQFRINDWVVPVKTELSEAYNYTWRSRDVRSHLGNAIKVKDRYWDSYGKRWIYTASRLHYAENDLMLKEEYVQQKKGIHLTQDDLRDLL